jgi:hypothetical protein
MIVTLAAALSLAASLAIDVPYLPQTDALCGGAAAAMVFRYWGDVHADPQEFAPLVDRRAGGIGNGAFVDAVQRRGWQTIELAGGLDDLVTKLAGHQPVVVLLSEHGTRYHYVVAVGKTADAVIIHDPSWGPSRAIKDVEFDRLWRASAYWGLVILPPAVATSVPAPPPPLLGDLPEDRGQPASRCDVLLSEALDEIRSTGFDRADTILARVRSECPASAGPVRELAGVRFAQRRWADAAALARDALTCDPNDSYALDVLGSSLFMQDDQVGALRAWNRIDKPRVTLLRIAGLRHTRHQTVAGVLGIQPNMLLTAETLEHARRRLEELPDLSGARLTLRPEAGGFASVDAVAIERGGVPRSSTEWVATGVRSAAMRSVTLRLPGAGGQGDVWSVEWGFARNRPSVGIAYAAPGAGRLPGVWRVEALWDEQTFASTASGALVRTRDSRLHAGISMSDWATPTVRYSITTGLDSWNGNRKAAAIGGTIERRWFGDRAAIEAHATDWTGVGSSRGFQAAGLRMHFQSSSILHGWVARATAGAERASDRAPLDLWPGAGDGQARAPLLRAHPLTDDGVIALGSSAVLGRSLSYGSAELQRWFERPVLARMGLAAFVDAARAAHQADGAESPFHVDVGGGVRLRIAGAAGVLRIDVAHGTRDGARALSLGWEF